MNILPKKRWHVRTKENIARVRRDEANAAEEEKKKQERLKIAEREARTELLRLKAKTNLKSEDFIPISKNVEICNEETGHINFFKEAEEGRAESNEINKEHEKEKKEEQEKYEKQIGYLTYLGQDTNEALKKRSWYDILPDRESKDSSEVNMKSKTLEDPLNIMKKYLEKPKADDKNKVHDIQYLSLLSTMIQNSTSKSIHSVKERKRHRSSSNSSNTTHKKKTKKHKKGRRKHHSHSTSEDSIDDEEKEIKKQKLEQLRIERLKRETEERKKAEELLNKLSGKDKTVENNLQPKQKYNSQYNPYIAKQNFMQQHKEVR
ncbi:leukocyte receptor cluster member 1 homolog [Agrilus planipennis]|uniref:Leukocyte receptor cluster member 1 homolog n=1 Tax=Agrilus planipennis TaxID=224129 RepID=A0A1W4X1Z0_AGRPL|nr:leukocyte receptor cluster member 1 homolog [Agrilus planipennis]